MIKHEHNLVRVPLPIVLRRFYGNNNNSADAMAMEMVNYAQAHSHPPNGKILFLLDALDMDTYDFPFDLSYLLYALY